MSVESVILAEIVKKRMVECVGAEVIAIED